MFTNVKRFESLGILRGELEKHFAQISKMMDKRAADKYAATHIDQNIAANVEICQRFVSLEKVEELRGGARMCFLESPTGTGKSTMIRKLVENNPGCSFLLVLNSVQLCKQAAAQFPDFVSYDEKKGRDTGREANQVQRLIICVNSVIRVHHAHKYDFIIFDEITNSLEQLKGLEGLNFQAYRQHINRLLYQCGRAMFLQAYIAPDVLEFVDRGHKGGRIHIRNTIKTPQNITMSNNPQALEEFLRRYLDAG